MERVRRGLNRVWQDTTVRQILVLLLDGSIAAVAFWMALLLRFEGSIPGRYLTLAVEFGALLVCSRVLASILLRLHRWSFRFSGLSDGVRIGAAGLFGTGLFMLLVYLVGIQAPPRAAVVLEFFFSTAMMAFARFSPRLAWMYLADHARSRKNGGVRTLIVGAGAAGEMLFRDLRRSNLHHYLVEGFVDDDPAKFGMIQGGKPVLGPIRNLPSIVRMYRIHTLLIAIPRLEAGRLREILALCADLKLHFKILPVSYVFLQDNVTSAMLQDVSPQDLLPRAQVRFTDDYDGAALAGRSVMVTGAAGSIGSEICSQLLRAGAVKLVMVDTDENGMYLAARRFQTRYPSADICCELASIRDEGRVETLFERHRPQDVFHAAAHKHVPLMEIAPCEAVKNNVMGTRILCDAADRFEADRFVLISTDKAVRPTSVMGATKRVAERIVQARARHSATRFCAVRFGNVLGSAGSVVPIFLEQIAGGGPVTVTDREVRRYFMTIDEAVGLVLTAAYREFGELCILDMGEQIRILDLARHLITLSGKVPDVDIPITFTGLRPGEKLYEELLTEEEERTHKVHERIFVAETRATPDVFPRMLTELIAAASREDAPAAMTHLRDLVPSFVPDQIHDQPAALVEVAAG